MLRRDGCRVLRLDSGSATLEDGAGRQTRVTFDFLVGADGSNSLVRRSLGLPARAVGLGLNAMLAGSCGSSRSAAAGTASSIVERP